MSKNLFTTHEVSKFCKVYPSTVINWINEGILPAFTTPGGHRRVKRSDLIALMKKNNMPIPDELKEDGEDTESGKNKVLVVDDDPGILKMVETILRAEKDLDVAIAKNGFEAGIRVSQWKPDVILLDMLMPEIDGFEVCRRIREDGATKDVPIIAVTVLKEEKELKKMYANGITDHLAKPFKSQELVKKVRKYINA